MNPVPLDDDLEALSKLHSEIRPLAERLRAPGLDDAARMGLLARVGEQADIGVYRTLALLLKANWQANEQQFIAFATAHPIDIGAARAGEGHAGRPAGTTLAPRQWRPWEDVDRFAKFLPPGNAGRREREVELLLLEQCALTCHLLGLTQVADLAARHLRASALAAQAPPSEQLAFADDKREWLRDELLLDELLELRLQVVAELEGTRARYLMITGRAAIDMVEAAHRLALMRYRVALNDPTLTAEELNLHLLNDLDLPDDSPGAVLLEPELRLALRDTVQGMHADHDALRRVSRLAARGQTRTASEEEIRHAARLFRRLARLVHPDALEQHAQYHTISPENRLRLKEIWHQASATHGARVYLSRDKLLNYSEHLQAWTDEAERILENLAFHAPSRLVRGNSLAEMHADLRRAMVDVRRYLHAVRDDIAHLEFDPQHSEYRRVIALNAEGRDDECSRMWALAERWNREAGALDAQICASVAEAARADARQLKGNKP